MKKHYVITRNRSLGNLWHRVKWDPFQYVSFIAQLGMAAEITHIGIRADLILMMGLLAIVQIENGTAFR
jgi:hypothetical protein